jgi:outer membrane protein
MNKQILLLLCLGLILNTTRVFSQNELKIGHANVIEILQALPATDSAQKVIEKDTKDLELMLEEMQVEYNKLVNEYQENVNSYSEVIRSAKESDIVEMQNRIQTFQQNSTQQLQERGAELMQPLYDKIQSAIDIVGKREGYAYILDTSKGGIVFTGEASNDIDLLIKQELGIADR